jgi:putative methionine-R-sulfoxide reductase with GAF domain
MRSVSDRSNGNRTLAETELESALQLLMERTQYITGATGAALALPQGEEMVCRASAGASAPAVGARLQVRSGLTGESISRRQLLRCDNAETDPRVNLETCRAVGIASIVVLPLLRRTGEVRGLVELFSDHPYAFEERDLIALERMAELTLTALDLAEQRQHSAPAPVTPREFEKPDQGVNAANTENISTIAIPPAVAKSEPAAISVEPSTISAPVISASMPEVTPSSLPSPAAVPEAMLRVQKCASCGFPVSEGRTFCLDCEKKSDDEKKQRPREQVNTKPAEQKLETASGAAVESLSADPLHDAGAASAQSGLGEFVPAFLANAAPVKESWLANHVNLLAVIVLILGVLVAVVVFR